MGVENNINANTNLQNYGNNRIWKTVESTKIFIFNIKLEKIDGDIKEMYEQMWARSRQSPEISSYFEK